MVWIDEVGLQRGALPTVYRRDFERGIVLCNATPRRQHVDLRGTYCKLQGSQAPLVTLLVDDTEQTSRQFTKIGGWASHGAEDAHYDDCWGPRYHHALGTSAVSDTLSSVTWQTYIPHTDQYTVYAWALPCEKCDATVTYTVEHAGSVTQVMVDPHASESTWLDLGTYGMELGTTSRVTLTNQSDATWVVADAIKLESTSRYNDGTCVNTVTLAGQDGIILLKQEHPIYLPMVRRE
jgi:hypothetical protein